MFSENHVYFWLNAGTLLFPLILSFDRKVAYYRRWKYLLPAIVVPGALFLIWDHFFTATGVWAFSPAYTLGFSLAQLPLEEWAFFLTVPYACVFIYDCLNAYFPRKPDELYAHTLTSVLLGLSAFLVVAFPTRAYTTVNFGLLFIFLSVHILVFGFGRLGGILRAWAVCLIPFALVNGVLTALPVVVYNNAENLRFRLGTIPFEDVFYGFLLFLLNVSIYEYLQGVRRHSPADGMARVPEAVPAEPQREPTKAIHRN